MTTLITDSVQEAAALLRSGRLVAFPTETVYGLGADLLSPGAVAGIYAAKGRPSDNPLIAHVAHTSWLTRLAVQVSPTASALVDAFFPGPLTLVLRRHEDVPLSVTAGLDTIGVRMPAHPTARAFLEACDRPVAAPSANRSGRPSPTNWEAVAEDLNGRIDCILRGPRSDAGIESTVVDCTGEAPIVLRAGVVTLEALRRVCPATVPLTRASDLAARSPGTRHRHYAPRARVLPVQTGAEVPAPDAAFIGLHTPAEPGRYALTQRCHSLQEYAYELFAFFRACDARSVSTIFCEIVPREGLGVALMDRIERAAAGSSAER